MVHRISGVLSIQSENRRFGPLLPDEEVPGRGAAGRGAHSVLGLTSPLLPPLHLLKSRSHLQHLNWQSPTLMLNQVWCRTAGLDSPSIYGLQAVLDPGGRKGRRGGAESKPAYLTPPVCSGQSTVVETSSKSLSQPQAAPWARLKA